VATDRDRWQALDELFHGALAVEAGEREAYVEARAGGDARLVAEVLALLDAHGHTHLLLDAPSIADLPRGMRVGPYALERMIGSGGTATVYLARRADRQFDKLVAVKLVNQGLAAEIGGDRFQIERSILARLEHPHIARLLDAGLSEFGQPYLVMEWVDGVALDTWIGDTQPTVDRRLDLWLDVADAVSYAHRNLIIHRDLKPSNVLVGRDGGAKLVDFGIAKLLEPREGQERTETLRLTPLYASPEQIRGEPVSTATDVYGLGLLLCELVTGTHPFRRAGRSPHAEAQAALSDDPVLSDTVPSDLAAIIHMALRKEPERRYPTVAAFVDDVRRYRRGLTVTAQADTFQYTLRRFVGRHRIGVTVALVVAVALVTSVGAAVWQARAAARQAAVAASERDRANVEATKAAQMNAFLQEMLRSADPASQGRDVRVADVLDRAAARIPAELGNQPEIEAGIRTTLATTYQGLGLYDPALVHARRALALREEALGSGHPLVAESLLDLGDILFVRGDYPESEQHLRRALAMYRQAGLGESLDAARGLRQLGEVLNEIGKYGEAEASYRTAIALYRRLADDDDRVAHALNDLGVLLGNRRAFAEAEPLHREALQIMRRVRGPEHLEVAETLHNVAGVVDNQGRYDEAEPLYREVLAIELKALGEDHAKVILTRTSLANLFWMKKDYARAEPFARTALQSATRALPGGHPLTAYAEMVLGQTLTDGGRAREGELHLRNALRMRRTLLGERHWLVANTESLLGGAIAAQGRLREAEPLLAGSYRKLLADRGPDHEKTGDARRRLQQYFPKQP
jgi:tetratricopeptide (TPR) repeat protein/tRNA A-37 threonylcarbamoyl transferase component Bud32